MINYTFNINIQLINYVSKKKFLTINFQRVYKHTLYIY